MDGIEGWASGRRLTVPSRSRVTSLARAATQNVGKDEKAGVASGLVAGFGAVEAAIDLGVIGLGLSHRTRAVWMPPEI